jgi:hypothetical protein
VLTGYSNATPSGSCSANRALAASSLAKTLEVILVANLLAGVDVNPDGHPNLS